MSECTKAEWRARLRAARLLIDDAGRHLAAAGLASAGLAWLREMSGGMPATTICAYVSGRAEPPTAPLLGALAGAGHTVLVPVCEPGHQLSWTPWTPGVAMARSALAPVQEPVGPRYRFAELGAVHGLILPALAIDAAGVRLGQGGGYYDRFLAAVGEGAVPTAGVVYEAEAVPAGELPHDVLDRRVQYILTPGGYRPAAE
ncbi:5-formyltetrahydrofolate cyclo-ligase [Specibacter sp. RAF43]|uniref:5-formyltetrahydrofolate cyclo-ligase n=1 Tax=Specibacter sp. RAF43 TaxID=3233057 RepID=UPI003F9E8405